MSLTPATRVGPYEIVAPLGAGGMGEVYRAKDARLGRDVAIKVLPFEFARDAGRLRRFEQEARALGALNHPNIVAIYDIGMHEDAPYVASELLEGESLRYALLRGRLSIRKVVDIAKQIACGLAAASAKGIVHRDLKPDNVFVLSDGRVKILDFGLAKQTFSASSSASENAGTAKTIALGTSPGMVMGTVGYMSPEQVRGQATDHRSDIFSFGCVLYETLTCERAFRGTSSVDVMSAILRDDARPAAELNPQTPAALDSILGRCLEKNPDRRFQSAADLAFALETLASSATEILPGVREPARLKPRPDRKWLYRSVAAVLFGAALAGAGFLVHRNAAPASFPQFRRLTFRQGSVVNARFTGDGKGVVYDAAWDGDRNRISSSTLGIPEARGLELPGGSSLVAVSSRGELALTLGPWSLQDGGLLGRSSLAGGPPREVLERVVYADWQPDGLALAVVRRSGPQWRIEYPIGKTLYQTANLILGMRLSPGGERVAFVELVQNEGAGVGSDAHGADVAADCTVVSRGGAGLGVRQLQSRPILDKLSDYLLEIQAEVLPKSPEGRAVRYTLKNWTALTRYCDDGDLEIDNNATEPAIRGVAVGRNNWTFFGSDQGGHTAAVLRTFVASCQRAEVEPFSWFKDVLSRIAAHPIETDRRTSAAQLETCSGLTPIQIRHDGLWLFARPVILGRLPTDTGLR